jgi:hypothetical protein
MNFSEITETAVNEFSQDGTDGAMDEDGQLTTSDYLELLLQKNKIPRTQAAAPKDNARASAGLQKQVKLNAPLKRKDIIGSPASPR